MQLLTNLAYWLLPGIAFSLIWAFWEWLVRRIYGKPRPQIVAILMFLTIAVPAMAFVVIFNVERASTLSVN